MSANFRFSDGERMAQLLVRLASIGWLPGWFRVRLATIAGEVLARSIKPMTIEQIAEAREYYVNHPEQYAELQRKFAKLKTQLKSWEGVMEDCAYLRDFVDARSNPKGEQK
jgi:hypothetical protein